MLRIITIMSHPVDALALQSGINKKEWKNKFTRITTALSLVRLPSKLWGKLCGSCMKKSALGVMESQLPSQSNQRPCSATILQIFILSASGLNWREKWRIYFGKSSMVSSYHLESINTQALLPTIEYSRLYPPLFLFGRRLPRFGLEL